ncbi:hypothetical protein NDU88_003708 [Pleurodeles waltl]|uniref:Uncharacterized protein n=1 Tax=Pleurodeles waltl TaxID=8319 RepID=A0AAV7MVD1_PLEWA|nr:hypothetical protein NDU88_003708 [Pleurodeles waltl]
MSGRQRVGGRGRSLQGNGAVWQVSCLGAQFGEAHARYDLGIEIEEGLFQEAGQAVGFPDSWGECNKMAAPIELTELIVISDSEEESNVQGSNFTAGMQAVGGEKNNICRLRQMQVEERSLRGKAFGLEPQHRAAEIVKMGCDNAPGLCGSGDLAKQKTAMEKRSSLAAPVKGTFLMNRQVVFIVDNQTVVSLVNSQKARDEKWRRFRGLVPGADLLKPLLPVVLWELGM